MEIIDRIFETVNKYADRKSIDNRVNNEIGNHDEKLDTNKKIDIDRRIENIPAKIDSIKQGIIVNEVKKGKISLESSLQKGNFGEMATDQYMTKRGYEVVTKSITNLNEHIHQGIDGVYYKEGGHPPFAIIDSKFGSATLETTSDGKQMSWNWIDKRLDDVFGKEKADEIREMHDMSDDIGAYVSHVDEKGNISLDKLDDKANVIEKDVKLS